MGKKIVASFKIDDEVLKAAKMEAISRDMRYSEAIEEALQHWMKEKR